MWTKGHTKPIRLLLHTIDIILHARDIYQRNGCDQVRQFHWSSKTSSGGL